MSESTSMSDGPEEGSTSDFCRFIEGAKESIELSDDRLRDDMSEVFDVPGCGAPQIDPGKMLFSASDDGTIKLWDLTLRTCIKQFTGHVGQVQSIKLLLVEGGCDEPADVEMTDSEQEERTINHIIAPVAASTELSASTSTSSLVADQSLPTTPSSSGSKKPLLISGSLDNTTKIWDIETAQPIQTFFGHIEGVWSVAVDKMRLVSGSHDRTIKVGFCCCVVP